LGKLNLLFLVGLLSTTVLQAHTYYVNTATGKDSNAGINPTTPWQTLMKVNASIFLPGDSICFSRGEIWSGQLTVVYSGSAIAPITVTGYGTGERPIIQNPNVEMGSAIMIKGSWIVVDGFLVRHTHGAGISIQPGADHNVVTRNEVTQTGMGVEVLGRYNLITGNYAHDLTMIRNTQGGDDDYGAVGI
jgi:hypothetical protein